MLLTRNSLKLFNQVIEISVGVERFFDEVVVVVSLGTSAGGLDFSIVICVRG